MAEYYSSHIGGRGKGRNARQKHRSIWAVMLDIVMSVISILSAVVLLIIFVGRFFEPDKLWYFSLTGLVAPIVYMAALACALYWIIRWRWRMFIFTAAFVALGWPHISLYYKVHIGKEYGTPRYERGNIKILSYNVRYLHDESWEVTTTDSLAEVIRRENPDIVCFQEFPVEGEEHDKFIEKMTKYNRTKVTTLFDNGVICFSKYRIIRSDSINGFCGSSKGLWADLKIGNDTVRLYNVHMQTTSINPEDRDYINNKRFLEQSDSSLVNTFASMAQRLYDNSVTRAHQANALRHDMDHCHHPMIVCGDFNDVPMSYTYRTIAGKLHDTFSHKGNGYAHTFKGFFDLLRIDYILVSKQFETLSYEVLPDELSDHYPVVARLLLKNKQ